MAVLDLSKLQTESQNARTKNIDTVSTLEMCKLINDEDATVAQAVEKCLPVIAAAIDACSPRIRKGGRLIYVGAGTSGRLGILDASEIPPTFSAPTGQFVGIIAGGDAAIRNAQEGAEDDVEAAVADLMALELHPERDVLLGIAASGRTPYVLSCLQYAKGLRCLTIGIACSFPSDMSQCGFVDHMISPVTGPEVVTGSTRMKAGTATKIVLNMLSTGIMVRIGKTYGNMMVDLKATNIKLKQRSRNMIRNIELTALDISDQELDEVINSCNGSVKLALMTLMTRRRKEECEAFLDSAGGVLSRALESAQNNTSYNMPQSHGVNANTRVRAQNGLQEAKLKVCIDGGGTKCAIAITDETGKIGRGEAGACNYTDVGLQGMREAIILATQRALQNLYPNTPPQDLSFPFTEKETSPFATLIGGIAGVDRPGAAADIASTLSHLFDVPFGPQLRITNDVDLLALTMQKHAQVKTGIVLIAGTGSVAISYKLVNGLPVRTGRSGGWGHILGDEGSGYDIGRQGIRAVLSALENARLTISTQTLQPESVMSRFHINIMHALGAPVDCDVSFDLLSHVLMESSSNSSNSDMKSKIASLAPIVLDAAKSDYEAASIVSKGADGLVSILSTLLHPANVIPSDSVLVLAGGLMQNLDYKDLILQKLRAADSHFMAVDIVQDAAVGGLDSLIAASK